MNMRFEAKYTLPSEGRHLIDTWLTRQRGFEPAYPRRRVHSIYFDTGDFLAARENLGGFPHRIKHRLRWYRGMDGLPSRMRYEIKRKSGRLGDKLVGECGLDPAALIGASSQVLARRLLEDGVLKHWGKFPSLGPILVTSYTREYYQSRDGVRLTIDSGLGFGDARNRLPDEASIGSVYDDLVIELKFPSEVRPAVAAIMRDFPCIGVRMSKYMLGLATLRLALYL